MLGAALGFGAQRMVQDMLSGFFIITEKQYGFGDLVQLSMAAVTDDALGTVEDVTLRVTKLRSTEGEMITIPNGLIVKSLNLSKDWARSVVDIPVPASAEPQPGQRGAARGVRDRDGGSQTAGTAAGCAPADGRGEHRAGYRQPADGGADAAG